MNYRKFRKNAKALSPVVASIILIAVTVAVSIAVAAWMGALTVGFMGSSSITVTNVSFQSGTTIVLTMKNTGTKTVTIGQVKINDVAVANPTWSGTPTANATIATGEIGKTVSLSNAYVSGNPYKFDLVDASGQAVGSYQATAP
jgi:flagellin-like protein